MHDGDSNALELLFMKEIHNFGVTIAQLSCINLLLYAWMGLWIVINVPGTWKVHIIDYHSLFLSVLSYREICYCVKRHSLQSIYYTLKNCWVFHPHYFEGFHRVHIVLWINDLCD